MAPVATRTRRPRPFVVAVATIAILLAHREVRAQDEPVAVEYRAHDGCPDSKKFWEGVATRTQRARLETSSPVTWTFRVDISRQGTQSVGRLEIVGAGGRQQREARDASCAQVADALALMVALTIDPRASLQPAEPPGTGVAPRSSPPPPTPRSPTPPPRPTERELPAPRSRVVPAFGAHALAKGAVAPDLAWGGGLFAQVALATSGRWAPALRLESSFVGGSTLQAGAGEVRTSLVFGSVDLCPARFLLGSFDAGACGVFELGVLRATGRDVPSATSSSATWIGAGGVARVGWAPGDRWGLEVEGGVTAPLERDAIVLLSPRAVLYAIPPVGATMAAGVVLRFP